MAPIDLAVPLECETVDDQTFLEMRAKRAANLAAALPQNYHEKSIVRQKNNLNNLRDKMEKTLRIMKDYLPDVAVTDPTKRFSAQNKDARIKELRAVMLEIQRQDDFLSIAKQHSYDVAIKVEQLEAHGKMDEGRAMLVTEVLKHKPTEGGGYKNPMKRKNPFFQQQQYYDQTGQTYYPPMYQPQMPGHMMYAGGRAAPGPSASSTASFPGPSMTGGAVFVPRIPGTKYRPRMDKSRSTCHACKLLGHWAGDPECPFSQQDQSQQPPPPGTG